MLMLMCLSWVKGDEGGGGSAFHGEPSLHNSEIFVTLTSGSVTCYVFVTLVFVADDDDARMKEQSYNIDKCKRLIESRFKD